MADTQTKLLQMPSDTELAQTLIDAAQDGAHDNIKKVVKQMTGYVNTGKAAIKKMVTFDETKGLSLNLSISTGDVALAEFINAQNLLVKGAAKLLMISVGAGTFGAFIKKMKERKDDSKEVTINTTSRIFTMFFQKLGEKYVVDETPEHIHEIVAGLFDQI